MDMSCLEIVRFKTVLSERLITKNLLSNHIFVFLSNGLSSALHDWPLSVRCGRWRSRTMGDNRSLQLLRFRMLIVPNSSRRACLGCRLQKIAVPEFKDKQMPKLPGAVSDSLPSVKNTPSYFVPIQ